MGRLGVLLLYMHVHVLYKQSLVHEAAKPTGLQTVAVTDLVHFTDLLGVNLVHFTDFKCAGVDNSS